MKKLIMVLTLTLILTGCTTTEVDVEGSIEVKTPTEEVKPLTKQVCDWFGWDSASIIEEQAQQGYVYTGRSDSFWCKNALNFQLKEGE